MTHGCGFVYWSDLAAALRDYLATKLPTARAFPMWAQGGAELLRADLARARRLWVTEPRTFAERLAQARTRFLRYEDEAGRVADFHSLRHVFATGLANAGRSSAHGAEPSPAFDG